MCKSGYQIVEYEYQSHSQLTVVDCYKKCQAQPGCLAFSSDPSYPYCALCTSADLTAHEPHAAGTSRTGGYSSFTVQ